MIIFRMFCALHTPAEEHQCDFDYQVSEWKFHCDDPSGYTYNGDDSKDDPPMILKKEKL